MSRILHRKMGAPPPVAVSGDGVILRDIAGKEYIDASGGAAVSSLGHRHPDVLAAMRNQLDRLEYAHTTFFTTEVAEALAEDLVIHAPDGLERVYLVSGGSEAMETALKLARQYFVETGEPGRTQFVARLPTSCGAAHSSRSCSGHTTSNHALPTATGATTRPTRNTVAVLPMRSSESYWRSDLRR